jgi:ketosteroid isomerase-like protein
MSQENVEVIRRVYDAYAEGGTEAALPFFDPEIEWHDIKDQPDATVHHGHLGVIRALNIFLAPFAEFTVTAEELRDLNDYVLAFIRLRGHGAESGAEFSQRYAQLWQLDESGKVICQRTFGTEAEALEAAGLSE